MPGARYVCEQCGTEIRNGEQFWISGEMCDRIRRGTIARTDLQVGILGRLYCGRCGADLARQPPPSSAGPPAHGAFFAR